MPGEPLSAPDGEQRDIGSARRRPPLGGQRQLVAGPARRPCRRRLETALAAGKSRPAQMIGHLAVEAAFQEAVEGMRIHAPLQHAGVAVVKE